MLTAVSWVGAVTRKPFHLQSRNVQTFQKKIYETSTVIRNNITLSEGDLTDTDDTIPPRHGKRECKPPLGLIGIIYYSETK